uniref:Uncharacterized protein n=1 Tax=Oryza rufipogon TaxID=4529 RepID=A0A0E0REE2_ORYRU
MPTQPFPWSGDKPSSRRGGRFLSSSLDSTRRLRRPDSTHSPPHFFWSHFVHLSEVFCHY